MTTHVLAETVAEPSSIGSSSLAFALDAAVSLQPLVSIELAGIVWLVFVALAWIVLKRMEAYERLAAASRMDRIDPDKPAN